MSLKSMENLILFMKREGSTDDFYRIFRIPFPNKPDIEDVIRDFIEVLGNYSNFAERIEENEKMKKRYEPLEQYSADILGYIATSIKLAGEGHVGESLAILRSAIDVFITSLFTSLTWIPYTSEDINPLADAFESPYYHRMKEISLDDILVNKIGIGEESEGKLLKDQIIKISRSLFKNYLNGMEIKENKIEPNDQKFDYIDHVAQRKHIIVDRIRYIGKESNNIDDSMVFGLDKDSYLEYENIKEFHNWILTLRPKDVRDKGISERELKRKKAEMRKGKRLNHKTKVNKILFKLYKSKLTNH